MRDTKLLGKEEGPVEATKNDCFPNIDFEIV